jgi:hypothetical protein
MFFNHTFLLHNRQEILIVSNAAHSLPHHQAQVHMDGKENTKTFFIDLSQQPLIINMKAIS